MKISIDVKTFNMTISIDPLNAMMPYSIKTIYSSYLVRPIHNYIYFLPLFALDSVKELVQCNEGN